MAELPTTVVGGVFPLRVALGVGASADAAPSMGNDLATRWREDLTLLAELGITAVRFPFDWSRLQPRPGRLDDDWREFYGGVLDAGAASACGPIPSPTFRGSTPPMRIGSGPVT